jgi:RNA polymerase sigma-70 factor (ECF subfamily)
MAATEPGPFERVYDQHVVGIYRFVYARVGNHPDAEDLTAQVFVRAVEQLDTNRDPGQIAAWLYRVAHNATADYWRAFYRLPLVGADHVAPGWEPAEPNARARGPRRPGRRRVQACSVASPITIAACSSFGSSSA